MNNNNLFDEWINTKISPDLQETYEYYSKLIQNDFGFIETLPPKNDTYTMQNEKQNIDDPKMTKNKIKSINIPNATIKRHSHYR